jgi:hypothetical protein
MRHTVLMLSFAAVSCSVELPRPPLRDAGAEPPDAGSRGAGGAYSDEPDSGSDAGTAGKDAGTAGKDAAAAGAAGRTPITCGKDLADCNRDERDGCEANLMDDLEHCGGCGQVCAAENEHATASCRAGECQEFAARVEAPKPEGAVLRDPNANPAGPYALRCSDARVLIGFDVRTDNTTGTIYSLQPQCARPVLLERPDGSFVLDHEDFETLEAIGNKPANTNIGASVSLRCAPSRVVGSLSGTVASARIGVQDFRVVTQLVFECTSFTLDANTVVITPQGSLSTAKPEQAAETTLIARCPGGAISGIVGESGGAIDQLGAECSKLLIGRGPRG